MRSSDRLFFRVAEPKLHPASVGCRSHCLLLSTPCSAWFSSVLACQLTSCVAEQVNEITPPLFAIAPDAHAMASMEVRSPAQPLQCCVLRSENIMVTDSSSTARLAACGKVRVLHTPACASQLPTLQAADSVQVRAKQI